MMLESLSSFCPPALTHIITPFSKTSTVSFCTQAGVLGFQLVHELQHTAGQDRPPVIERRADARQRLRAGAALRPQMGVSSHTVRNQINDHRCCFKRLSEKENTAVCGFFHAAKQHISEMAGGVCACAAKPESRQYIKVTVTPSPAVIALGSQICLIKTALNAEAESVSLLFQAHSG